MNTADAVPVDHSPAAITGPDPRGGATASRTPSGPGAVLDTDTEASGPIR